MSSHRPPADGAAAQAMQLLVFAHTPPPHHGQSYMVKLLLDGLRIADCGLRIEDPPQLRIADCGLRIAETGSPIANRAPKLVVHHVNCRFSDGVSDIGQVQGKKLALLFRYVWQAIRIRLRHGPMVFYYVPAPGLRAAIYRDWLVMVFCRPFFSRRVFHWHGVGLGEWLEANGRPWERWLTRRLLGGARLSIVLGEFYRADVARFAPKSIQVVANGIPDPCPEFDREVLPQRQARCDERRRALEATGGMGHADSSQVFRVLFLSLCMREKGVFDAVDAIALANRHLTTQQVRFELTVAGTFYRPEEQVEFERRLASPELRWGDGTSMVRYAGFVGGEDKRRLFLDHDALIFPSYYPMEGQPVSVIEAMAYGMVVVACRWRSVPELFPRDYSGLVDPRAPIQLADALLRARTLEVAAEFRARFLSHYTADRYVQKMKVALQEIGGEIPAGRNA